MIYLNDNSKKHGRKGSTTSRPSVLALDDAPKAEATTNGGDGWLDLPDDF
jgi:hypothetical protein